MGSQEIFGYILVILMMDCRHSQILLNLLRDFFPDDDFYGLISVPDCFEAPQGYNAMKSYDLPKSTILIVDDNPENLDVLLEYLEQFDFDLFVAQSGADMLAQIESVIPDLILVDILMPGMNGFEACRKLKACARCHGIPVIFMSAVADTVNLIRSFEAGGVDYITKPFQYKEVLARIKAHLTIRWQHQQIQQQDVALEAQSLAALELNARVQELTARLDQEIREREQIQEELADVNQELQRLASLDRLTQVANRRQFDEYLSREWQRMAREQRALSLILCDIDRFQQYNDTYGHLAGDDCLKQVAQGLQHAARRPADLVARYGGEQFAMVLPNTDKDGGVYVAQKVQVEIQQFQIPHAVSDVGQYVTLSIGLATIVPQYGHSIQLLIKIADDALSEAKEQGRNRFIIKTLSLLL